MPHRLAPVLGSCVLQHQVEQLAGSVRVREMPPDFELELSVKQQWRSIGVLDGDSLRAGRKLAAHLTLQETSSIVLTGQDTYRPINRRPINVRFVNAGPQRDVYR